MAKEQSVVLQWATLALVVLLGLFVVFRAPVQVNTVDTAALASAIVGKIIVPEVDLTDIEGKITEIEGILNEEDNWKKEAIELATDELEDRDYKELRKWMVSENGFEELGYLNGDYKEIEELKVTIKDSKVLDEGFDIEDKDAEVEFDLRVYFEDVNGDKVKKYVTATVTIKDGEVEDQKFLIE